FVLGTLGPIDSANSLIVVAGRYNTISDFAARVLRWRQKLYQGQRCRIETLRIDKVARRRDTRSRIDDAHGLSARHASGRIDDTEVPAQHFRRRNIGDRLDRIGTVEGPLESAEEEQLVADNMAAESAAELVALQAVVHRRKCVASVHVAIAQEL